MPYFYMLLTPAFNEANYIKKPLESVVKQSIKPIRWLIVDDGSTDETAKIIKTYARQYKFIHYYYRSKPQEQAYFSSNVFAIMEGYERVKYEKEQRKLDFDYIAILDADIALPEDYYETIIGRMEQDERLGIASGIYENLVDGKLQLVLNDRRSTPKAIMVFRRQCFEDIGGFLPLQYGGEDTAACVMARMKGWKVWSFPDIKVVHHRPTGTGNAKHVLYAKFVLGFYEYGIGSHPLFVIVKSLRRCVKERPYVLGGIARIIGYLWKLLIRETRKLPNEVVRYVQREQLDRIYNLNKVADKDKIEIR